MIIGLCGLIGCGKGTVGDILVEEHGFTKISFADKLKDGVAQIFGWDRALLEGDTDRSRLWREKVDEFWTRETGRTITPRIVLQEFGTDCMRNGFYDGVWVSLTKKEIIENPDKDYVVTDVRFENEVNMIKSVKGSVWRVQRGLDPVWLRMYQDVDVEPKDVHESEWRWVKSGYTLTVHNNGSLEELKNQVSGLLASNVLQASA